MCGIDENGLGPYLGPLIITSVESEDKGDGGYQEEKNSDSEEISERTEKIKDSKAIFSRRQKDYEKIEKIFLSIFNIGGSNSVSDIFWIFLNSEFSKEIFQICPISPDKICFQKIKLPLWIKSSNKWDRYKKIGSRKLKVRYAVLCPGLISKYVKLLGSKFSVDAYFMVKMAFLSSSEKVICGKSGFKKNYKTEIERALQDLNLNCKIKTEKEENEESIYEICEEEGKTIITKKIHFIKDADEKFYEVALASQIGKYIREVSMLSLTKFLHEKSTFPISGYGKKEDLKKIAKSVMQKVYNQGIKIPKECIERNY